MRKLFILVVTILCVYLSSCTSRRYLNKKQEKADTTAVIRFDDTRSAVWDKSIGIVDVKSPIDKKTQKAYFYKTTSTTPQPLVVSLHTWSGNYTQQDSISTLAKASNYNYIHPDFRGPNNNVEACGSRLALSDIDASIDFAIKHGNVDPDQIFVIGVSGGGYATLNMFMHSKHKIRKFSAWASISDLVAWYNECTEAGRKYAHDIYLSTGSKNNQLDINEAKKRSPLYSPTPVNKLKQSALFIATGVHDGITGSVPFTHSINLYNKVLKDLGVSEEKYYVSDDEIEQLIATRKPLGDFGKIGGRTVCLQKQYGNIKLVIFDGGHEMLTDYAFLDLFN